MQRCLDIEYDYDYDDGEIDNSESSLISAAEALLDCVEVEDKHQAPTLQVHKKGAHRHKKKLKVPRWSDLESILLEGVVVNVYRTRHSFKPTEEDRKLSPMFRKASKNSLTWKYIHDLWTIAKERFAELTNKSAQELPYRSLNAIQKRWKEKCKFEMQNYDLVPLTKIRSRYFDEHFNPRNILLCPTLTYLSIKDEVKPFLLEAVQNRHLLEKLKYKRRRKK